jgi:CRISPR-associated protein Cmr4
MKKAIVGLFSETALHPGAEGTLGAIDLPVAREATTDFPVIPGTALKGAIRDKAENVWVEENRSKVSHIFGEPDQGGSIIFTDARLLLLPVRSLTSHYRWVTSPYILERFQRDLLFLGNNSCYNLPLSDLPPLSQGQAICSKGGKYFLEELSFESEQKAEECAVIADVISKLIFHSSGKKRLREQLVVVSDDDFKYLAKYSLPVNARNQLDDKTKTSENLWYEEIIPPDTLLYTLFVERVNNDSLKDLRELFNNNPYLQVGGNETVGQGWCIISWVGEGEN